MRHGYCGSCGSPISGGYKFCSMCSGNMWQGSDDYAMRELERQQQEADREREEVERHYDNTPAEYPHEFPDN